MNVKKVFLWSFGLLFTLGILGCAAVAGLFYWASRDLPDLERLTGYEAPQATAILARDGSTIGTLATEKRYSITLKEMSPWLPMSFLAAEDDSFYQHHGVDPVAIVRAFIYNLRNKASGGGQQGGSTITQQIIKQLLLSSERSYTRKMKEAILAYRLEHTVSKDDILQTYLNYIYLGQHAYGVEAAARTYFGKHASDITLAESAVIAGLPQAPSRYNPFRHPEAAKARLIANPGCYPSSAILGLYAAFKHGLISPDNIVIYSKPGTSGAGRKPVVPSLFCEVYDTFRAYGLGKHRHTPEIEQEFSRAAGCDVRVSFNPHLVPMVRGILSTIYTTLRKPGTTLDEVHAAYCETWAQSPWVRVLPKGKLPETRFVRGSMFCDLGLVVDPRTNRLIVVSAIDNLCRGASGQALANANLMCGLPVDCGLNAAPMLP